MCYAAQTTVCCILAATLGLATGASAAPWAVGDPKPLNRDWSTDLDTEGGKVSIDTDRQGTLVAVWGPYVAPNQWDNPICGEARTIKWARSEDGGASWGPVGSLGVVYDFEVAPDIATDRHGTWVVVWDDDTPNLPDDVFYRRSTDNGRTWSPPAPLGLGNAFSNEQRSPAIAADETGTFVVTWSNSGASDKDILFSRSTDHGATWSPAALIDPLMISDSWLDWDPDVATNGAGTWLATWHSTKTAVPGRITVARSIDGGATWPLIRTVDGPAALVLYPLVAGDAAGNWVVAWKGISGIDRVYSQDNAGTWSPPGILATGNPLGFDWCLASDGRGNWLAVWGSKDLDGTPDDNDLVAALSQDHGVTWLAPQLLEPGFLSDGVLDDAPDMVTDGRGNWTVAWTSFRQLGGSDGPDSDLLVTDVRLPFPASCAADLDGDGYGGPGDPSCPLGPTADCNDADVRIAPGAVQSCDGVNNDCTHPSWPSVMGTNEVDGDGDGFSACQLDCDDGNSEVWSIPGEVGLLLAQKDPAGTLFQWTPPEQRGGTLESLQYDLLRTDQPFSCLGPGEFTCVEAGMGPDTEATDADATAPGTLFFYLVRAGNACSAGFPGVLGETSAGSTRWAAACER